MKPIHIQSIIDEHNASVRLERSRKEHQRKADFWTILCLCFLLFGAGAAFATIYLLSKLA